MKGPDCLDQPSMNGRNLFLCYPDEAESLGVRCLEKFRGMFLIHIGEMIHGGTLSGALQSPWGRTTAADFQVKLAEDFHCLLRAEIPRFPFSYDQLSVWKRSRRVSGNEECVGREQDQRSISHAAVQAKDGRGALVDDNSEEDADMWVDIPEEERLPDVAAPCLRHLL